MTKRLFATSFLVFLLASTASAWDMGAYVENKQAGEGNIDSALVQKIEQKNLRLPTAAWRQPKKKIDR